jgi:purine-nucleoside phosphorylase
MEKELEYTKYENIKEAADFCLSKTDIRPEIGLILGSGLGSFGEMIEESISI